MRRVIGSPNGKDTIPNYFNASKKRSRAQSRGTGGESFASYEQEENARGDGPAKKMRRQPGDFPPRTDPSRALECGMHPEENGENEEYSV